MKVRLGWHDSGTYDRNIKDWPERGGANGSLRFDVELKHGANAGIVTWILPLHFFVPPACTASN
jgi:catalase (peroxidase I)